MIPKMKNFKQNKKGGLVLRDIVFMIFIFSGIIAFSSVFVSQMATEYGNDNMSSSYSQDVIGEDTLITQGDKWEQIGEDLSGDNGVIKMLTEGLYAIGSVLLEGLKAPNTFSKMLTSTLDISGASEEFQNLAGYVLSGLLYALIIFAIIKVFLRGGDI